MSYFSLRANFANKICLNKKKKMENAKKCIEEALDSLNIHRESMKLILKEKQERAMKEFDFGVK